jgi:putative acetyltransferase
MNEGIILRHAVPEDLKQLQSLFVETINEVCRNDYTDEQRSVWTSAAKNEARWLEKIKQQYFLIAEHNNNVVGYGSLENGDYLDFMYVHKDFQRQGIADKIFRSLEQEAKQRGSKILKSDVSKTARHFFERQGFRVIEAQTKTIDSVEIMNFKMQKLL